MAVTDQLFDDLADTLYRLNLPTGPACMRSWLNAYRAAHGNAQRPQDVYAAITELIQWQYVIVIHNPPRDYYLITPAGLGDNLYGTGGGISLWWDEFLPDYVARPGLK